MTIMVDPAPGGSPSPELVLLSPRGMSKVPTIASESELRRVEAMRLDRRRCDLDPRRARALRRKLYVDLYREVAGKGFI